MEKLTCKKINARGWANSWLAEQLKARAVNEKKTMAEVFEEDIQDSCAFNVPAMCIKLTKAYAFYVFNDGSAIRIEREP